MESVNHSQARHLLAGENYSCFCIAMNWILLRQTEIFWCHFGYRLGFGSCFPRVYVQSMYTVRKIVYKFRQLTPTARNRKKLQTTWIFGPASLVMYIQAGIRRFSACSVCSTDHCDEDPCLTGTQSPTPAGGLVNKKVQHIITTGWKIKQPIGTKGALIPHRWNASAGDGRYSPRGFYNFTILHSFRTKGQLNEWTLQHNRIYTSLFKLFIGFYRLHIK